MTDERPWPLDPDVEAEEDARHRPSGAARPGPTAVFAPVRRSRWPRIHWGSVAAVAAGGFAGGLLRYLVTLAWAVPAGTFPWPILVVNTAGVFVLAVLLVLVLEVLPRTTYLRPAVGTGFCGGLTTFSSVAVAVDQLVAGRAALVAGSYLAVSVLAGLAAVALGVMLGRAGGRLGKRGRTR